VKINDAHLYHGAALCQIAEHESFTAINVFETSEGITRSAFRVNSDIAVYLKYASKPNGAYSEYIFTFNVEHLRELDRIGEICRKTFIAMVCVKGRQVCCLPLTDFRTMIKARLRKNRDVEEEQYTVLVTLPKGKAFRVYMNEPGRKKITLGTPITVARNKFPKQLFE